MTKTTVPQAAKVDQTETHNELAQIDMAQVIEGEPPENSNNTSEQLAATNQSSLLTATRSLLRQHGIRKSVAAVREAVDTPHDRFTPTEAANALSNLGFKTSFGSIKFKQLTQEHFPLIALYKTGEAILLTALEDDGSLKATETSGSGKQFSLDADQFIKAFSGYVILAKELSSREKEDRSGHWFFSAFSKSKWR